jgi:Domain of unknown function (DUF4129)
MKVLRRAGMLFMLFSLLLTFRGAAQQAADTVGKADTTVGDTIVVSGSGDGSSGSASAIDTSTLMDAGREGVTGSQEVASLRSVPDSVVDAYKKNRHYAYANDPAYWHRRPEEHHGLAEWLLKVLTSTAFRDFIYIALGGLLLFVIIRVMSENNLGVFYRKRIKKQPGKDRADETPEEEDIDERLQHYLGTGDHRQAVRYLYLRSLRGLSHQGLIKQTLQATNHEYLRQMSGTAQERPFRFLLLAYERVWYGEFPLGQEPFQRLYRHFVDFDKTVTP